MRPFNEPTPRGHEQIPENPPVTAVVQTRRTLAGVMLVGFVLLPGWWALQVMRQPQKPESDPFQRIQTRVNPNDAMWYELAQLPGLGESAGRAIVAYREERRRTTSQPVFKNAA